MEQRIEDLSRRRAGAEGRNARDSGGHVRPARPARQHSAAEEVPEFLLHEPRQSTTVARPRRFGAKRFEMLEDDLVEDRVRGVPGLIRRRWRGHAYFGRADRVPPLNSAAGAVPPTGVWVHVAIATHRRAAERGRFCDMPPVSMVPPNPAAHDTESASHVPRRGRGLHRERGGAAANATDEHRARAHVCRSWHVVVGVPPWIGRPPRY